jgi:hypothetical protein
MKAVLCVDYIDGKTKKVQYDDYLRALEEQRKVLKSQKSKIKECKVIAIKEE